mgnify:CR=1 FL=1|tara:strand:- start:363 stop:590 length:228 start_codon:yes stop_codon:yes gene_type:complete
MAKSTNSFKSAGQATIEYLFVMIFIVSISIKMVGAFSDFMRDSVGNLGHVLSQNLTVGVCEKQCFFGGFKNGYEP